RLDPTADSLQLIFETVKSNPRRVVFAEGEEERTIRAAIQFKASGFGEPVLVAREDVVKEQWKAMNLPGNAEFEIHNARLSPHVDKYREFLYRRLHRKGYMPRDCQRMVNQNRNI